MNHVNNNLCPVCGYDGLEDGTASGEICSSCGTEFGYSDFQRSHLELRRRWISEERAQWWSRYTPMPSAWSPVSQLRNIGHECTVAELQMISRCESDLSEPTWMVATMGVRVAGKTPAYVTKVYVTKIVSAHSEIIAVGTLPTGTYDSDKHHAGNKTAFYGQSQCQAY